MPVYVDDARLPFGRMLMSHMLATTETELHCMAGAIGLRRQWFQQHSRPHYDVSQAKREAAIHLGAIPVTQREIVRITE